MQKLSYWQLAECVLGSESSLLDVLVLLVALLLNGQSVQRAIFDPVLVFCPLSRSVGQSVKAAAC